MISLEEFNPSSLKRKSFYSLFVVTTDDVNVKWDWYSFQRDMNLCVLLCSPLIYYENTILL